MNVENVVDSEFDGVDVGDDFCSRCRSSMEEEEEEEEAKSGVVLVVVLMMLVSSRQSWCSYCCARRRHCCRLVLLEKIRVGVVDDDDVGDTDFHPEGTKRLPFEDEVPPYRLVSCLSIVAWPLNPTIIIRSILPRITILRLDPFSPPLQLRLRSTALGT